VVYQERGDTRSSASSRELEIKKMTGAANTGYLFRDESMPHISCMKFDRNLLWTPACILCIKTNHGI